MAQQHLDIEATAMLLACAADLKAGNAASDEEVRAKSSAGYASLVDAHGMALAVVAHALQRRHNQTGNATPPVSKRLVLLSSFVQGIDLCATAITTGRYVQAAALLKQEMETLAAIEEVTKEDRRDGRTPNVKHLQWGLGRLYGSMNNIAHLSKDDAVAPFYLNELADDGTVSATIFPIYRRESSRHLFGLHIALVVRCALAVFDAFADMFGQEPTEEEVRTLSAATTRLVEEGWMKEVTI